MADQSPEFEGSQSIGDFPVKIKGNDSDTLIGNIGDRLKTTNSQSPLNASQLNYLDMNASNGGIARGTTIGSTFTNLFSYAGSGDFYGFHLTLNSTGIDAWYLRLIVDGSIYPFFGSTGLLTGDLNGVTTYDLADSALGGRPSLGLSRHDNSIRFESPIPIRYGSSIALQARNTGGSRAFQAGFVKLTKET